MENKIRYSCVNFFEKDLKRLLKRFCSLNEDIKRAKVNAIETYHVAKIDNHGIFSIQGYCCESVKILKVKKFSCKSLKGFGAQSGIRIIYAFYPSDSKVEFIEIYYKGDKENEDRERIKVYFESMRS
jgi:hypothetical protein